MDLLAHGLITESASQSQARQKYLRGVGGGGGGGGRERVRGFPNNSESASHSQARQRTALLQHTTFSIRAEVGQRIT